MLPKDELQELADDIKKNGLVHPIVIKDGVLIDGRNRREACRIAGVQPETQELNGEDIEAYIISSNINRRHMSKGQQAMAVAIMYPEGEKGGRGKKINPSKNEEFKKISAGNISMARTVLQYTPGAVKSVMSGGTKLDKAYEEAKNEKDKAITVDTKLEKLRESDPDLATQVVEEVLALDDAVAVSRDRRERERVVRQGTWDALSYLDTAKVIYEGEYLEEAVKQLKEYPKECPVKDLKGLLKRWIINLSTLESKL
jgi:hypothetical protein